MPARFRAGRRPRRWRRRGQGSERLACTACIPLAADHLAECVGPRRKDTAMTQNRDRKQAIRARMAETGEPYTEAARNLDAPVCGDADGGPGETAGLVDQILGGYREHAAAETAAVPGRVLGSDVEGQADALE